jgi:hypothetical protein
VSRSTWVSDGSQSIFAYRTITYYGMSFQNTSTNRLVCNSLILPEQDQSDPTTPTLQRFGA